MSDPLDSATRGMGKLKGQWSDFAGDLLEPMVLLAAGATKAQAAWAGLRGVLEARVLGPLGLVAGASIGFLATTKLLVGKWKEMGMVTSGALERMVLQFRPLLGSMDRAKERIEDLKKFAVVTPFELDEIVEANKLLEQLTKGALSTEKGMTLVGDAASVADQRFGDVARMVGRLYDGLMSGRPVGEATMRLQEMAVISGTLRNQIESMQASNASGLAIWALVEKQLEKNTGAMGEQSKTLEGLQSTFNDTKQQMEAGFSDGFLEGEKAGVESAIKVMEALSPVMVRLGKDASVVSNFIEKLKLKVVESVTGWSGFSGAVEWAIKGMVGLAAVLAGASTAAIAGFGIYLLKLIAGNKAAAASTQFLTAQQQASIPVSVKLASIKNSLVAASRANAAGLRAEAMAHLGTAGATAKNALATNGLVGIVKVGSMAWVGLGAAVKFVGAQMRVLALGLLANPMVWMLAAVAGLTAAFQKLSGAQKEAKERLESYTRATGALDAGLKRQIAEIRTMIDLRQAEAKILTELASAYRAMESAKTQADRALIGKRIENLQNQNLGLPSAGRLERGEGEMDRAGRVKEGERRVKEMERDAIAARGPEEALAVAEERLNALRELQQAAVEMENAESAAASRGAELRQRDIAGMEEVIHLTAERNRIQEEMEKATKRLGGKMFAEDKKHLEEWMTTAVAALDTVNGKLRAMMSAGEAARIGALLASPSELQRISAMLEVVDSLAAAVAELEDAQSALDQAGSDADTTKMAQRLADAKEAEALMQAQAGQAGVAGMDPRAAQDLRTRRDDLEARRGDDMDPERVAAAEKERRDAALALATARVDAEMAVEGLRLRGFEREQRLLEMEEEKLLLRLKGEEISGREYDRQQRLLNERRAAMEREGQERRAELGAALEETKVLRLEEEARRSGQTERAEAMRARADELAVARVRRDAAREAEGAAATAAERQRYVEAQVAETRAAQAAERRREDVERAAGRDRDVANQNSAVGGLEAELLRRQGKGDEARKLKERLAREQDELNRAEAVKRYSPTFGEEEAGRMADRDVKLAQAGRMMEELSGARGTVVASSLAKIGGGGAVTGTDPNTRLMERMVKALEDIRNDGRKEVDDEL